MNAKLIPLAPIRVSELLQSGEAVLVDIREADEFVRRHVKGALSRPLSAFEPSHLGIGLDKTVVFACRTGMRTEANCDRLAGAIDRDAFVLEGGLDRWAACGLPVEEDRKAPLEIMRQVQIAAGLLVLAGVSLGLGVHPAFFALAAFVGAGLTFAGVTGFCGLARLLRLAPWNAAKT